MKAATKGITIVAALLLLGGVASYIRVEKNIKPLALNIIFISATLGITNELTTAFLEAAEKNHIAHLQDEIDDLKYELTLSKNKYTDLSEEYKKQSAVLTETKSLEESQAQEIESKQATIDALTQQIYTMQSEFKRKTEEIDEKLAAEGTQFKVEYRDTNNIEEKSHLENGLRTSSQSNKVNPIIIKPINGYIEPTDILRNGLDGFKSRIHKNGHYPKETSQKVNELLAQLKAEKSKVHQLNRIIDVLYRRNQDYIYRMEGRRRFERCSLLDCNKPCSRAVELL